MNELQEALEKYACDYDVSAQYFEVGVSNYVVMFSHN